MILLDFSQVMISNIFAELDLKQNVNEGLIRHMVLKSLRSYKMRFGNEFGEIVICCDSSRYWRRGFFSYYKSNRKSDRDKSGLDWDYVFRTINKIKQEMIEYFPYKVIEVDGAEADDIIGALTAEYMMSEPILILSGDKDFKQLHLKRDFETKYKCKIRQYAPIQKEYVTCDDPDAFLREQIIRGDRGDGIPNILSSEDCLYNGIRQNPVSKRFLDGFNPETTHETIYKRYQQNETLIDLQKIPTHLYVGIKEEFNKPLPKKKKLMDYFIEHQLKEMMPHMGDF